MVPLLLE
jgi:hypothetical protein